MTLRFILGRAGVGKTRLCLDEIKSDLQEGSGKARILLVPEQATFQMEKILLEHCGIGGTMDTQVLSFQRLAWRVMQETGGGLQPVIDDLGKSLVLRLLLEHHGKELKVFNRVMDKPGFIDKLRECITEFKVYQVETERLRLALEGSNKEVTDEMQAKLEDLILLYETYQQYLTDKYLDSDDYLLLLTQKIQQASFLTHSEVWIDGFHGFTPAELEVIRELMLKCRQVNICLSMEGGLRQRKLRETSLFYPPWETYQRLQCLAAEINCPQKEATLLNYGSQHRFSEKEELAKLESYLATGEFVCPAQTKAIRLVATGNRRMELEGVALEITRLCREEGFHYKDIGLLFRNFESYESLLPDVFSEYEIPYFTDFKRTLVQHPLLDLIKGALEVAEKGWNYEAVFRYLKTDLAPILHEEVDILENYCLAFGIRGSRWTDNKPWTYRKVLTLSGEEANKQQHTREGEAYLRRINKIRHKAVEALSVAVSALGEAETALDYAQVIFQLLTDLAVAKKLEYWANQAEKAGSMDEAQIHSQVWQRLIDLLDQLVEVLGQEKLTLEQFSNIMDSGLASMEIGLIPLGLDQVLVGSIDRSRNPALKAVFVLGINEGVLPARYLDQRLINDPERQVLQDLTIDLAPTGSQLLFAEQFAIYNALTRASHYLWLSYPLSDVEGKALSPSPLVQRLAGWLLACGAKPVMQELLSTTQGLSATDNLAHPGPALNGLAQALRLALQGQEIDPQWLEVYNWYQQHQEWRQPLQTIISALWEENQPDNLTPEEAQLLYGLKESRSKRRLATSISRLEKFAACPFAHFLNYGLRLKEREEFKLKSPDIGQLFHAALEGIFVHLKENSQALVDLSPTEIAQLVDQVVDSLIPNLQNELLLSTARYRYLARKLKRIVRRAVTVLKEHERKGTFRPIGIELSFGPQGEIPGMQFTLKDGTVIELQGRIDRVDGATNPTNGDYYLRIIDYKSGSPGLNLLEVFYGLKLQLISYLDVLLKQAPTLLESLQNVHDVKPGGILYFSVQDPLISDHGPLEPQELEKRILKELKMKGYLLREQDVIKAMDSEINGYSEIVPAALSKSGEFYRNSDNLLTTEQFNNLCSHVEKILTATSEDILSGQAAIAPFQHKGRRACKYCPYLAICRFDTLIPGYRYRNLRSKEAAEVWAELASQGGEDHE